MNGWEATDTGWLLTIGVILVVQSIALPVRCYEQSCSSKLEDFFKLQPSEMGDTLAGIFSSLAFIWIIVTVFLQRNELREQRKENREQRLATEDMARAMKAQAKVFEDEQKYRSEARAAAVLEQVLKGIQTQLVIAEKESWYVLQTPELNLLQKLSKQSALRENREYHEKEPEEATVRAKLFDGMLDVDENVRTASSRISDLSEHLKSDRVKEIIRRPWQSEFRRLRIMLDDINRLEEILADDQKIRLHNMRIAALSQRLDELLSLDVWKLRDRELQP